MPLEDPTCAFIAPVIEAAEAADEADFLLQLLPEASTALKAPRKGLETAKVPVEETGKDSTAAPLPVGDIVADLFSPEPDKLDFGTADSLVMGDFGEGTALLALEGETAAAPVLTWEEAATPGMDD